MNLSVREALPSVGTATSRCKVSTGYHTSDKGRAGLFGKTDQRHCAGPGHEQNGDGQPGQNREAHETTNG